MCVCEREKESEKKVHFPSCPTHTHTCSAPPHVLSGGVLVSPPPKKTPFFWLSFSKFGPQNCQQTFLLLIVEVVLICLIILQPFPFLIKVREGKGNSFLNSNLECNLVFFFSSFFLQKKSFSALLLQTSCTSSNKKEMEMENTQVGFSLLFFAEIEAKPSTVRRVFFFYN